MNKYICYGCGRTAFTTSYLSLCIPCRIYRFWTKHNPNKLGYENAIKELEKEKSI